MLKTFRAQIKNFFDAKLPFEILEEFKPLDQELLNKKTTLFEEVNDDIVKIDINEKRTSIFIFILLIVFLLFFLFIGSTTNEGLTHPVAILINSVLSIFCIFFLIKIFIDKKAYIILNRETGMFTFPYRINKYKSYTVAFNKAIVYWVGTGGNTGNLNIDLVTQHPDEKFGGANLIAHERWYTNIWSFYVWYMDKNRPLPPGSAFDPYRQRDFERRKAEGFPKPLYRSHIPTPEATPEQQAERDNYWKDETESFTREPHSVMYAPEIHKNWRRVRHLNMDDTPVANTYFKFEFENGTIVYMKTDKEGRGVAPPKTEKFKGIQINLMDSWF